VKTFYSALFMSVISILSFVVATPNVQAHQQRAAISTALFNYRSGNLEISHRFYMHDAEHAIKHLFGKGADIYNKRETQMRFGQYISQHFALENRAAKALPLELLGVEVDSKFIWVYQEVSLSQVSAPLASAMDALLVLTTAHRGKTEKQAPSARELKKVEQAVKAELTEVLDLSFQLNALQEIWGDQVNTINIEGYGPLQTLVFRRGDEWQSVELNPAQ